MHRDLAILFLVMMALFLGGQGSQAASLSALTSKKDVRQNNSYESKEKIIALIDELTGVYVEQFEVIPPDCQQAECEEGRESEYEKAENRLQIAPINDDTIYVSIFSTGAAGNFCDLSGPASYQSSGAFLLEIHGNPGEENCKVEIRLQEKVIVLNDVGNICTPLFCGMGASFGDFPLSERKTTNVSQVIKSEEYQSVLKDYQQRRN